jgi:hypothetical protein
MGIFLGVSLGASRVRGGPFVEPEKPLPQRSLRKAAEDAKKNTQKSGIASLRGRFGLRQDFVAIFDRLCIIKFS